VARCGSKAIKFAPRREERGIREKGGIKFGCSGNPEQATFSFAREEEKDKADGMEKKMRHTTRRGNAG